MYILIEKLQQNLFTKWKKLYESYNFTKLDFALSTLALCSPRLYLEFLYWKTNRTKLQIRKYKNKADYLLG